jgi:hypothetical protein
VSNASEPDSNPQLGTEEPTGEVGSEGGSPGDLEHGHSEIGTGSEAGELWQPAGVRRQEVWRNQGQPGRRSP